MHLQDSNKHHPLKTTCLSQHPRECWTLGCSLAHQAHSWCLSVMCHMQLWLLAWSCSVQQWSFTTKEVRKLRVSSVLILPQMQELVFTSSCLLRCQETAFPTSLLSPSTTVGVHNSQILNQNTVPLLKRWHRQESALFFWQVIAGLRNKSKSATGVMPLKHCNTVQAFRFQNSRVPLWGF